MYQKTDLIFQKILRKIKDEKLDFRDIKALNQRLAMKLPILGAINIVKKQKNYYFINCLPIEMFICANNSEIIIFLKEHD